MKVKTKSREKTSTLAEHLETVPFSQEVDQEASISEQKANDIKEIGTENTIEAENNTYFDSLFDSWDEPDNNSEGREIEVPINSLESGVGYSSLFRQMHRSFLRKVAFHKSPIGGSLSTDEARNLAFHACNNKEEAKERFRTLMRLPLESLNFVDLMELQNVAPRAAERFWERVKREGRKEFETGHLAAGITFPVAYMKEVWNLARYVGVRESFIDDWKPKGGIEISLIDILAQSYFQWQYWLELTVTRSSTKERTPHPEYTSWMERRKEDYKINGWSDGYWFRPYVSEQEAVEHSVQMADRWNRIFMRTLRQLRDLRRYAPVTINNANQVNIASEGARQVNVSKAEK